MLLRLMENNSGMARRYFEKYVGSYRKTPSVEPEPQVRAHSEPAVGQGRQALMKRDERKLEEITDARLPSTSRSESMILAGLNENNLPIKFNEQRPSTLPAKTQPSSLPNASLESSLRLLIQSFRRLALISQTHSYPGAVVIPIPSFFRMDMRIVFPNMHSSLCCGRGDFQRQKSSLLNRI